MILEMRLTEQSLEICGHLHAIFDNDYSKVMAWLTTKNLNFGGCSPLMLINRGRGHKVLEFVEDANNEEEIYK